MNLLYKLIYINAYQRGLYTVKKLTIYVFFSTYLIGGQLQYCDGFCHTSM